MKADFYRAFEDKYRGGRDVIKSRLSVYVPFVSVIKEAYPSAPMLDLGCGRGEWLEILRDFAIHAYGIDLDSGMLSACQELGLSVQHAEAITTLKALPDETHSIISGFHIAEHLAFADLCLLIEESLRVLKPGGLLILETPNPENIGVGSSDFYLDPTHQRPLPPLLLAFVPEYYGFEKVKVLRLQEPKHLIASDYCLDLLDVLIRASPDYGVVAQKGGHTQLSATLHGLFEREYGLTLGDLAIRYDDQHNRTKQQLEYQYQQLEYQYLKLSETTAELWRATAPLRLMLLSLRGLKRRLSDGLRKIQYLNYTNIKPVLKRQLLRTVQQNPGLESIALKLIPQPLRQILRAKLTSLSVTKSPNLEDLSDYAVDFFYALKSERKSK
ncbi:MAG: class I SAM-dependent methyltransferase [Nodosilinea sp.]